MGKYDKSGNKEWEHDQAELAKKEYERQFEENQKAAKASFLKQQAEEAARRQRDLEEFERKGYQLIPRNQALIECAEVKLYLQQFRPYAEKHPVLNKIFRTGFLRKAAVYNLGQVEVSYTPKEGYSIPEWAWGMEEPEIFVKLANQLHVLQKIQFIDTVQCQQCSFHHGTYEGNILCGFSKNIPVHQ